ncbi:MAG: galactokinase [Candidatus Izemoplasmatales bacterium]|nr:galactokinase [Candidatus Izemoplasmatales bacterium]
MFELLHRLFDTFANSSERHAYFSPGRVNLIGEHIDYNGGQVMPFAIEYGTYGIIAKRTDQEIRLLSAGYDHRQVRQLSLSQLERTAKDGWTAYVKGVISFLIQSGVQIDHGFDIVLGGDLPTGSGLSSSASLESLIAVMLNEMFDGRLTRKELALLCQKVENQYVGVQCGIMDQFVILNSIQDQCMVLDTHSLDFEMVPLELGDHTLVIIDSKIKRQLQNSAYNQRREECRLALDYFRQYQDVTDLCHLDEEVLREYAKNVSNPVWVKRAHHCVSEQQRVLSAKEALLNKDFVTLGRLLNESHDSLRDDYEVSVPPMDDLIEIARKYGSLGSRMTGAGFGGCSVHLIEKKHQKSFVKNVLHEYESRVGLRAKVLTTKAVGSTHEVKEGA